ncbi:sugar transferase [Bacillus cereus]|uniref:sugar transferase n=1 Tax=Bacillus pseudomycoides TaxID=64104 RepID=UPI001FB4EBA1|nr:sugar transferase [Bacillus pseudomycoides]WJE54191.1 sugar transferase [Bacillus cereus]
MNLNQAMYEKKMLHIQERKRYIIGKRCIDIIGALIGIIILLPVFVLVGICIKLSDSKHPVFFKQERVGKDEKIFYMYKFRTMVHDAEKKLQELLPYNEVSGAMFKMKNDPRITKLGKILRKTSIDELPQLWNVLKGEMSLVGPRPPLVREIAEYTEYEKQRLLIIPGCTGLWQVSGRSQLSFEEMVELDLMYIQNRTILYDMKIIAKTIRYLLKNSGAY